MTRRLIATTSRAVLVSSRAISDHRVFPQLSAVREANATLRIVNAQTSVQLQALREEIELVQVSNSKGSHVASAMICLAPAAPSLTLTCDTQATY